MCIYIGNRTVVCSESLFIVCKPYGEAVVTFALFKGQANAINYPNPLLRTSGDIDLFLYQKGDYDKANQWVKESGYVYHVDYLRDGHRAFEIDGKLIENHKYITFFERKKYNTALHKELDQIIKKISSKKSV